MIQEVVPNLYRLEIELPNMPLKTLSSYLIKGVGRNLIIDTGLNHPKCLESMHSYLKELGVDLRETDIFITHHHADHAGLVSSLVTDTSMIYCSKHDSYLFSKADDVNKSWDEKRCFMVRNGFPENQVNIAINNIPNSTYACLNHIKLSEGDILCAGTYQFRCIETPGHSKGHLCLYEPDQKLLVAGDHINAKITPNIALVSDTENPLKEYLESLEKVENLEVDLVLTGHGSLIKNCRQRILELKHHCERRDAEVLAILKQGEKTTYQLASELKWDMNYESWESFSPTNKLFAICETGAHLIYIKEKGFIKSEVSDQQVVFSLN
ncbi:MAG: MBL fold metallo-hydrolase [Carboxydocellales bacterium]